MHSPFTLRQAIRRLIFNGKATPLGPSLCQRCLIVTSGSSPSACVSAPNPARDLRAQPDVVATAAVNARVATVRRLIIEKPSTALGDFPRHGARLRPKPLS